MPFAPRILTFAAAVALSLALPIGAQAQSSPLIMPGKDSLFERVLVRDATSRFSAPGGDLGAPIAPLTALYVYAREEGWLQVGLGERGADLFWIPDHAATAWNQNIVATFETSENLERLLFFSDIDPIYDLLEMESPGLLAKDLRAEAEAAEAGGPPSDTIAALGPRRVVDQRSNLYVMPIIDFQEEVFDSGAFVNLLEVAVARAQPGGGLAPRVSPVPTPDRGADRRILPDEDGSGGPSEYKLGVVFVVDTTVSMNPYIQATRDSLQEVYRTIDAAGFSDAVSFGLIGYRDNLQAAPDLGYSTRTFVSLQEGSDVNAFLAGIDQMTEAETSSRNFREDAYAGVEHALAALDWSDYSGRFIVLVTDAGPREVGDEYSQTGLSGAGLNTVVRERINGAIAVFHLKTERGANDHASAEAAYRELSRYPNQAPFYYPIEGGDPGEFRSSARSLGEALAADVQKFRGDPDSVLRGDGERSIPEEDGSGGSGGGGGGGDTPSQDTRFSGLLSAGRTMQLAYLGQTEGTQAPDVFQAFVADRDFDRTGLKPLSIRVLITKAQLSALFDSLSIIIEQGEENVVDPGQFFAQVLGAAADMSRTPDKVTRQSNPTLAEAVAIDEYIEDLPYRSRIMNITEDDWLDMSFSEQATIINDLYDKIARYQEYNEATDLWVDYLGTGAEAENLLYPLPLDDLP